jgi:hypothetical protein
MAVKATVLSTPKNRVSINNPQRAEIRTVGIAPSTTLVKSFRGLSDVDATNLANNNTVVYDPASDKFIVKELPVLNGGTF